MSIKVFFIYLAPKAMVSFVRKDFVILSQRYLTTSYCYRGKFRGLLDYLRIFLGILVSEVNVSWFAYDQAYFAVKISKLLGKKSVVIIGGFDVAEEETPNKEIGEKRKRRLIYTLDNADRLICISERLKIKSSNYTCRNDIKLIYHGFDGYYFRSQKDKEDMVITIGFVKKDNLWRKGHECFVKSAKYLPECKFVLIGQYMDDSIEYLKSIASENVEFTGWVSDDQLLKYMQKAKVYVQVSYHEGFGLSLAESMLCECVPVVTERGAIPEVVGDTGYYVPFENPLATSKAIEAALKSNKGLEARQRVLNLFPLSKREHELSKVIDSITQ